MAYRIIVKYKDDRPTTITGHSSHLEAQKLLNKYKALPMVRSATIEQERKR